MFREMMRRVVTLTTKRKCLYLLPHDQFNQLVRDKRQNYWKKFMFHHVKAMLRDTQISISRREILNIR